MGKRYYIVDAVCGHVGKNNGIIKSYAVHADDGKQAAAKARQIPRVKHDYKYAIRNVREVSFSEFILQIMINDKDPYLHVRNRQEQRLFCESLNVFSMEDLEPNINNRRRKRTNLRLNEKKHQYSIAV